jgi:conjugal transfer ATP-binding protein TraC
MSGSGKSFFADDIVTDALSRRKNVRVLDYSCSRRRLTQLLGGNYLRLRPETPVSLNIFSGVSDLSTLKALLPLWTATLAELLGVPQIGADSLSKLLTVAWKNYREKLDVPALATSMLSSADIEMVRLGAALQAFYLQHAGWLDGPSILNQGARFTVVDVEDLQNNPTLDTALRQLILANLAQEAITSTTGTLYMVDEGWYILKDMSRAFSEEILRSMKAANHLFGSIIQSTEDANSVPFVQCALEQADYLLLMRQRRDALEKLSLAQTSFAHVLTRPRSVKSTGPEQIDKVLDELCTVRSGPGYSEIAILAPDQYLGIYRFAPDRATYYSYTTNPRDIERYNELLAQGHTSAKALGVQVSEDVDRRQT